MQGGASWGYRGAAIRLLVGSDATAAELRDDWKAVHEMTHLALPDVHPPHLWLAEGLATYVEPIARVEAGDLTPEQIWGDMLRDMKKGLPAPGDQGLDGTDSWGRTYWGGAMFCLLADIEIRKQTGNKVGLQQAQRGILAAGGNLEQDWPVARIFSVGDQATGAHVLADLYAKMGDKPYAPDLRALWQDLGVSAQNGRVSFNDTAPLAPIAAPSRLRPRVRPQALEFGSCGHISKGGSQEPIAHGDCHVESASDAGVATRAGRLRHGSFEPATDDAWPERYPEIVLPDLRRLSRFRRLQGAGDWTIPRETH